jgi:hypothetical protein
MCNVHFARIKPSQSSQSSGDIRIKGFIISELIAIVIFEGFIDEWSIIEVTVNIIDKAPKSRYNG